ncbi:Permease of the drug/metabolite transporter (DMT) superfamily [Raineyella antarctica]|uniref:Permease of the drug/metabolite transporter (DMT) superfamily n=1 Tax=Raineyella antarctica TaxID=1577474 RepID=A0A1G6GF94_9ACTN|nr:DMT family transporter [Raineyella antarctica]SDB80681.1 Permease of the drug/metabolite transporter (DMT) superfamily [Raineyella antarctica]
MDRRRVVAMVSLVGATVFWAGNYVVGVVAVGEMGPVSLVFWRWLLALVPLVVLAQLTERPDWRAVLRRWPWIVVLSLTGLAGYNLFLYAALQYTDAFNASLINAFNPALILLASALFLRQPLTPRGIGGVLLALVGVLVVLTKGTLAGLEGFRLGPGELLMLGAIGVWTAYTIIGRRGPKLPPITSTAAQALVTLLATTPFVLAGGLEVPRSTAGTWSLAFIAIFPSVLSYLLWNRALTVIEPGRAGVYLNLITVFTAIAAVLMGQALQPAEVIGGALVIGGVALTSARRG